MNNKPLVSVIIPCYNGERFIHRLLDSLLSQTYPNLEIIIVDDGSTDKTALIIQAYISKFAMRNNLLTYVYQKNAGQSYAINKGLKLFTGKYLVWPDADDFYVSKEALSLMVDALENSSEDVSMVRSYASKIDEDTMESVGLFQESEKSRWKEDLFLDCLFALNGFWFVPGQCMIKSEVFLKRNSDKHIFEGRYSGQNWQMMLPVLYKYRCLTIRQTLYSVLIRKNSSSRWMYGNFDTACKKNEIRREGIIQTLLKIKDLPIREKECLIDKINRKYDYIYLKTCVRFSKSKESRSFLLSRSRPLSLFEYFTFLVSFLPFSFRIASYLRGK